MADTSELAKQILGLLRESLQDLYGKLKPEDQQNLVNYSRGIAERVFERRTTNDPARQAKLESEIAGYEGAIHLMIDRYLLTLNHEVEQTLLRGLKITATWLIKIVIAAAS
jgi:hypothetical protein